ncbi:RNA replicase [Lysinibacillus fusiformis]|uniref:rolling circle replication-associated protein n=1 Tax=Lysinibacillus fusiformis TaxID=28031 RepID=UPI00196772C9|nr:RNA replicase [Lysinibacillus fusiformis]QSB10853.1 RNA replicase [Lysinibacillus fusiformis]
MDYYDCVLKLIGDEYIIAKKYGARIKKRERSKKTDDELQAEIKKIKMDASLSDVAKMTKIAILKNNGAKEKISKKKETQVPKGRKLTMKEKETFSDLMDMNFKLGDKYVTLTYAKEDVSLDEASQDFDNWIKRMRERYSDFKYLGVRSFQERGTVHFHVLMTIPDIPIDELRNGVFQGIWGHGHVDIEKIYSLSMVGKYAKLKNYLIKNLREFKADERSFDKNLLLKSKNLEKPEVIRGTYKEIKEYLNRLEGALKKIDEYRFSHEYLNYITSVTFIRIRNKNEN